jgi:hypothetical protein
MATSTASDVIVVTISRSCAKQLLLALTLALGGTPYNGGKKGKGKGKGGKVTAAVTKSAVTKSVITKSAVKSQAGKRKL